MPFCFPSQKSDPMASEEVASLTRNSSSRSSRSSSNGSARKCRSLFLNMECDSGSEKKHICSAACIERYPIHHAARLGDFTRLKELLEDINCTMCPLAPDECLGRTPLHYASATGNVEKGLVCVKLLLECRQVMNHPNAAEKIKKYVNHADKFKKSALHLAAKNEATQIVIELLMHQADFDVKSADGICALREIYKNTPDAMEEALNQSISYVETCMRPNLPSDNISISSANEFDFQHTCVNVCLNFYPVIGSKMSRQGCEAMEGETCKHGESCRLVPETRFLFKVNKKRMEQNVRRQILTNVLVQSFLHFKWQKVKLFCFLAIFFHTLWLSLYIGTVISVFVVQCPYSKPEDDDHTDIPVLDLLTTTEDTGDTFSENETINISSASLFGFGIWPVGESTGTMCQTPIVTQLIGGVLLCMSFTVFVKEIFQFIRLRFMYIRFENLGQCMLLAFIFITVPPIYFTKVLYISSINYQISAFGIFLGWTLLLCQLAKLPRLRLRFRQYQLILPDHGIYVEILSRVFKNFLIFITIFSSLLISFVFSFNILLPNSPNFANLSTSIVKVLTMMIGELNFEDVFYNEDSKLVYPVSSHLMYAIFIMVATIILFNLLIGFTVSDIVGLQKDAEINQISNKLEQVFLMECFLLSGPMRRVVECLAKLLMTKSSKLFDKIMVVKHRTHSTGMCYHTTIKALPRPLRVRIRNHASKNCMALSDINGAARSKLFGNFAHRDYEH